VEPSATPTPDGGLPKDLQPEVETVEIFQDSFRKVYLGQVSDPIFPPHPGRPESADEELLRAALEDPASDSAEDPRPTPWRIVTLIVLTIAALGMIFLSH
jgi:hypothetical protein